MSEHLLTNIEIKDFKCFKDFKAEGFKRVNLIGGKNNVGKTAFMEACYINVYANNYKSLLASMYSIKYMREYIDNRDTNSDNIKEYIENCDGMFFKSNINLSEFRIDDNDGIKEYIFHNKKLYFKVNINEFSYGIEYIENIEFIAQFGFTNVQLKEVFESVQRKDKEEILYRYINEFDENIVNFKIIGGDKPQCKTIDGGYRDINEFGDGLKHYISIICSLYTCENGYLFIDEIGNGIHYTQLDRLWKIILTVSKEQNVQVFATTHSKECIESYARVAKELEDEDISFIELGRNKKNESDSIVMNSEMFLRYIKIGNEVRGW